LQAEDHKGILAQRTAVTGVIKKPRHRPDYRLEALDNEILLYHPTSTKVLYLNETASMIWKLCNGTRTTGEITELLQNAFPEQAATIDDEVEATLRNFVEQGAIEFV
jgi:hypothetical protein